MAKQLTSDDRQESLSSSADVDLYNLAKRVDRFKNSVHSDEDHKPMLRARVHAKRVAIVLDGTGSSSARLYTNDVIECVQMAGFKVTVFSYQGPNSHRYEPRDTLRTGLSALVDHLDKYIAEYSTAENIVLIGYSLGGLIATEWMYRYRDEIELRQAKHRKSQAETSNRAISGMFLLASPIRICGRGVTYSRDSPNLEGIKGCLSTILAEYTADLVGLPLNVPLVLLRCENDKVIDDSVYTFDDCETDDLLEEFPIENTSHMRIPTNASALATLKKQLTSKCGSRRRRQ